MGADLLIRRTAALMESRIDDDLVALDVDQGACYAFNATAARIWDLTEHPIRLSELRQRLLEEFQVDAATCDGELRALLAQFKSDGLVTMEPAPA